ncbi:hypothetical protein [Pantoea agglomerans]|uniref:Uncharacterized protein n=1 Tax=Enterobacter agglomerans TaxID=549 RepID=A0ACC5RL75_ENTAG|nr:hypothetical protein [Pantoea agglomerans]MBK4725419.1 hypothetical protein [Pantoea agglomerans]
MAIKNFSYSQFSNLFIEGVGIHASFSINLIVKDENTSSGKNVHISATGKSNVVKAAGSGSILFWCKIKDLLNNKIYNLERKRGEYFAMGIDDILIGSTYFKIQNKSLSSPRIEMEAGYFYDSGYTGAVPPFPGSMKKTIILTPFGGW